MKDDEILLSHSYTLIRRFIDRYGEKSKLLNSIRRHVKHLYYRYGITRSEIASRLFCIFEKRKRHLKYDADRSSLENYVAWFVYYELLTLIDQCQKHLKKPKIVSLSENNEGEKISMTGCPIEPYERQGIDALINPISPEDELIGQELMEMALEFFGNDDMSVLLGARDRKDEAHRLGIDYCTYCKRLKRKTQRFRSYLIDIGYFD